ncbi:MAG TPA: flagellar basal body-associated FliL family protein [Planctomycetota bacterium]|nr:flagellar basal body-associated FliL family protein [Planctomycetota bacterium]
MPHATVPERTGASGPYFTVPPPPPRRMLSPMGYLGLGVAMIVAMVVVFSVMSAFRDAGSVAVIQDGYEEVDLGQMTRELSPEVGGLVRDAFTLKVVLVLNPKVRDLGGLKAQVERRRNLFRDIVWSEIISPKSDADLRKPAALETLKGEIRQRLNQELGGSRDGQELISRVLFPDRRLPERR